MDIRDRFRVPPEFPALLKLWTTEVLRAQPANIPQFSADFFDALLMSGMERKMNSFGTGSGSEFYAADSLYSAARELENQQAHQAQYGLNASMMSSSSASTSSSSTAQAIASAPARDPRSMILLDRIPDFFPARVHPITVYTLLSLLDSPSSAKAWYLKQKPTTTALSTSEALDAISESVRGIASEDFLARVQTIGELGVRSHSELYSRYEAVEAIIGKVLGKRTSAALYEMHLILEAFGIGVPPSNAPLPIDAPVDRREILCVGVSALSEVSLDMFRQAVAQAEDTIPMLHNYPPARLAKITKVFLDLDPAQARTVSAASAGQVVCSIGGQGLSLPDWAETHDQLTLTEFVDKVLDSLSGLPDDQFAEGYQAYHDSVHKRR